MRNLRSAYRVASNTNAAAELETVKNAISVAQNRLFDAEVDRVREELSDGGGLEE